LVSEFYYTWLRQLSYEVDAGCRCCCIVGLAHPHSVTVSGPSFVSCPPSYRYYFHHHSNHFVFHQSKLPTMHTCVYICAIRPTRYTNVFRYRLFVFMHDATIKLLLSCNVHLCHMAPIVQLFTPAISAFSFFCLRCSSTTKTVSYFFVENC